MRYNPKSFKMLNRDMLKRDLFFVLAIVVITDIYFAVSKDYTSLKIMLIVTAVLAVAVILYLIITDPKRLIPDTLIDAAEKYEIVVPEDATKRITNDLFPTLKRGKAYKCRKGDADFDKVCEALKNLKGARTKIEPDYPRLNITIHTANDKHLLETFYENVTFGGKIYRVRQKDLDDLFFNEAFVSLFHAR